MADKSKDTGSGGINIGGDLYTMDVGAPDAEGGKRGQWSPGDVSVDNTVKDITKPTRETFAKYLSRSTLGQVGASSRPNFYPVGKGDSTSVQELKLKDTGGYPVRPAESPNEKIFASVQIGSPPPPQMKKGLAPGDAPDGNTLLRSSEDPTIPSAPVTTFVSEVLKNNRFSANSVSFAAPEYFEPQTKLEPPNPEGDPDGSIRENFESNTRLARPDQLAMGTSTVESRDYGYRRLSRVGTLLQMRASGEKAFIAPGADVRQPDASAAAGSAGIGQTGAGQKLPLELINIESIIRDLSEDEGGDLAAFNKELIVTSGFEGVLNNVYDKFTGFSAQGMVNVVLALVSSVVSAFNDLGKMLGFDTGARSDGSRTPRRSGSVLSPNKPVDSGRHGGGSYGGAGYPYTKQDILGAAASKDPTNVGVILGYFGISTTNSTLKEATLAGAYAFFNVDQNLNPLPTFNNPGFYAGVARSIIRSAVVVLGAFQELSKILNSPSPNAESDRSYELLNVIKTSRLVACINIFAQIGDKGPKNIDGQPDDVTIKGLDVGIKRSTLDAIPDNSPSATWLKSRLGNGKDTTVKLAWANNRAPANVILPVSTLNLGYGESKLDSGRLIVNDPLQKTRIEFMAGLGPSGGGRIPTEMRERFEFALEAEYMPFYFHDLRTNEILSFHAFLGSLSDDYTANYESSEGIGRMDPIKAYKSTQRKIGLSFTLAALDEADFDDMWLRINKLTTMVYPQWTAGRKFALNNYQFTKPFTQQISAPPMIRLRVGNLFATNYSKFNLARIFGFDMSDAVIDGTPAQSISEGFVLPDPALRYKQGYKYQSINKTYRQQQANGAPAVGPQDIYPAAYPGLFVLELVQAPNFQGGQATSPAVVRFVLNDDPSKINPAVQQKFEADKNISVVDVTRSDVTFVVNPAELVNPTVDTQKKIDAANPNPYSSKVLNFVSDSFQAPGNSIARSFRTAGGQGLAGFIDSLGFDWYSSVTWDTSIDRKAPKMCKITISFSPIHDIQPGLDANGYNRAPIYPLGPHAHKTALRIPPAQ